MGKRKGIKPPKDIEEVRAYQRIRPELQNVDANFFFNSLNDSEWVDSNGKLVYNWKLKLWTWSRHNKPAHICVVCRKAGHRYQMDTNNQERWLCKDCCQYVAGNWGKMPRAALERIVEQNKAALANKPDKSRIDVEQKTEAKRVYENKIRVLHGLFEE